MRIFISTLIILFSFGSSQNDQQLQYELAIENRVNKFRAKYKRSDLKSDDCLKKAAQLHAEYLLKEKNLSHFQKNKELKTPEDRVKKSNCEYIIILENVAYFEFDNLPSSDEGAEKLVNLWIQSKGHKENMINKMVTQFGTAVAFDFENKKVVAVQVFSK